MNVVLRGLRIIDPLADVDRFPVDVWLRDGRIVAIEGRVEPDGGAVVVDMGPADGRRALVLCPGFIDLHAHLREPGDESAETIASGASAAAAGGFTQVVAMANTSPPVDTPGAVEAVLEHAAGLPVRVLPAAALTRGLGGRETVDVEACAAAGAAAFTDDGRNAAFPPVLVDGLRRAAGQGRAVLVHPEDEDLVRRANPGCDDPSRCPERPPACEVSAVAAALVALDRAGAASRLHLQHLSAAGSVALLARARTAGAPVTAEVTPHHIGLSNGDVETVHPRSLVRVNPPLRTEADRLSLLRALGEGLIDAVATDHAPHSARAKGIDFATAAPGMTGLETALALCITLAGLGDLRLPMLIDRMTAGPWRVLGPDSGLREPRLRVGETADCVLVDAGSEWILRVATMRSRSSNTPLLGRRLRGRVLLTIAGGAVAHVDTGAPRGAALAEVLRA